MPLREDKKMRLTQVVAVVNLSTVIVLLALSFVSFAHSYHSPGFRAVKACSNLESNCAKHLSIFSKTLRPTTVFHALCTGFVFIAGLAVFLEFRSLYRVTGIFSFSMAIYSLVLVVVLLGSKRALIELSKTLFNDGVEQYFKEPYSVRTKILRNFVDSVQSEYRCCGYNDQQDFSGYNLSDEYIGCIKNGTEKMGPLLIPITCCKNVFAETTSGSVLNKKCGLHPTKLSNAYKNCPQKELGETIIERPCSNVFEEAHSAISHYSGLMITISVLLFATTGICWILGQGVIIVIKDGTTEKEKAMASVFSSSKETTGR